MFPVALLFWLAEQSHELWVTRMRAGGWAYGEVKDPALLPFAGLPAEQQLKDRLFIAVVRALASADDGGR